MGNIVSSFFSGFFKVVSTLFGAPLDFLAGKSCSTLCGSTWDLICYIENFCVGNLLKMVVVLALFYIVLLFFYLLYKMGICDCIGRSLCKMTWALCTSYFNACEYGCMFLWIKLRNLRQTRQDHIRDMLEEYDSSEDNLSYERSSYPTSPISTELRRTLSHRLRERRQIHMRRSLRPRSHRIKVGIRRDLVCLNDNDPSKHFKTVHNIKVTRTSKFVQKGNGNRIYRKRRW
ncbi:uncharacterized protein LOC131242683 [Magnolia sinica]|uniref:uncharacterized protein LOC131242683 n=1 Tax=Magnolia sinica TaxID=86752 RepID=UPI0026588C23|nr:uncharacterized protein LOC131242683 [Magnolia sinica]XP_058097469.1 uncharacterized protein LOC131242683 [Magnolia sinica]XP_058097470.1 uncharacterized protein LOC131242683 [Magnolia sinica]XP_058097471.1 uncharacterized protein LOC131242683 [Magnolia sinica]XP_058097472.1 uncharacterized protein LOC131242683 [Magnolia sinica]